MAKVKHREDAAALAKERGDKLRLACKWSKEDFVNYRDHGFQPVRLQLSATTPAPAPVTILSTVATSGDYKQESLFPLAVLSPVMDTAPAPDVVEIQEPAAVVMVEPEPVNIPLPVTVGNDGAVNTPLPVMKSKKSNKGMMPNGRTSKGVPDFKNWFGRVYPVNITYPSWKLLSKTSTDVANICIAKRDHAAARNKKDTTGVPVFEFTFSEAVNFFKISRPTFDKSIKQLIEIGFIEYSSHGGIVNGHGVMARYRLSEKWKTWSPSGTKSQHQGDIEKLNILSAKQKPSKPVLHQAVNIPLPVDGQPC